jgi:hypothetical protein
MKRMKLKKNKKGLSIMIGYVLLITFAIIMSTVIYQQLKSYTPKDKLECGDGISMYIQEAECIKDGERYGLNLTLKNNGKFGITGYYIRGEDDPNKESIYADLSSFFVTGDSSLQFGNSIQFVSNKDNAFYPNDDPKLNKYSLPNKIYSLEIIPLIYKIEENKKRLVSCSDSIIHEKINCQE